MDVELPELPQVAHKIANQLQPGDILTLIGSLASGKTTLTQQILQTMGYQRRVTSPTFVLEHRYPVDFRGIKTVIHLDFYRLKADELRSFDWHEYLGDKETLTIIEWPEIGSDYLPPTTKTVKIEFINDQKRQLTFSSNLSF